MFSHSFSPQYSEEKEKKAEKERKKIQLKALEDKWKVNMFNFILRTTFYFLIKYSDVMIYWLQLQHETMPESGGSWWGYGASLASLAANIVENIQVCEFVKI